MDESKTEWAGISGEGDMAKVKVGQRIAPVVTVLGVALACLSGIAAAQTPTAGFSGLNSANSKKPIDIESDKLEVDDKKHVAIFTGSVSATQGDYNLIAATLEVFYENGGGQNQQTQAPASGRPAVKKVSQEAASSDPISSGQINHIHAFGGMVVVKNAKDEQQATGDDAYYDVKTQKIIISGKKVVLTQKKNVIEGRKLLVDLSTSQATVLPDEEPAKGQGAASSPKGRVQAILQQDGLTAVGGGLGVPKKKDEHPKLPQPASKQPGAWQPQPQ